MAGGSPNGVSHNGVAAADLDGLARPTGKVEFTVAPGATGEELLRAILFHLGMSLDRMILDMGDAGGFTFRFRPKGNDGA